MSDVRSIFEQAVNLQLSGRLEEAERVFREVLTLAPDHADCHHLLGIVAAQQGRHEEAINLIQRALVLNGEHPVYLNNLAEVLRLQGRLEESLSQIKRVIELAPTFPDGHYGLGNVMKQLGQDDDAVNSFRKALELQPKHAKARFSLANTLREQGRVPVARKEYEQIVAEHPHWFEPRLNFGVALLQLGECDEALRQHMIAHSLRPEAHDVMENIGDIYVKQGLHHEAKLWYSKASELRPSNWLRNMRTELLGDVVAASNNAIDEYRTHVSNVLDRFKNESLTIDESELHLHGAPPQNLLTYQGRDDRPLREKHSNLFAPLITPLKPKRPAGKPSIGIVVTSGHEGVFGRCLGDMLDQISSKNLDITIVCSFSGKNILRHLYPHWSLPLIVMPERIDHAAQMILDRQFHLVLYWEVGTDSTNYFLPLFKPCVHQATTWGWPVTSGNSRIDDFVSADCLELPNAQEHYVENLVRLPGIPTFYKRPRVPTPLKTRRELGIGENDRLYFCPQNLRKIHPDFDPVLAEILRQDSHGRVLLVGDEQPTISAQLEKRFKRTMPDVVERVFILSRLPTDIYLNVLALANVNLDTFHYGGGANTVFDTFATGTPMVTLPGPFHRSRFASGVFQLMEITSTIASSCEEYVNMAVDIANNHDRRQELHADLMAKSETALENQAAVHAWEQYFLEVAARTS